MTIDALSHIVDATTYVELRAQVDAADAWIDTRRGRNGWASYKPEDAPDYVNAVSNGVRSDVQLYELYHFPQDIIDAYTNDRGQITTWPGCVIGTYRELSSWRTSRASSLGDGRVHYIEAMLPQLGRYRGRNGGPGLVIRLRRVR